MDMLGTGKYGMKMRIEPRAPTKEMVQNLDNAGTHAGKNPAISALTGWKASAPSRARWVALNISLLPT